MDTKPGLDTPAKLARAVILPFGKKGGRHPSPRAIQYLLDEREDAPAPGIDIITGVAMALGRQPWELLLDEEGRQAFVLRLVGGAAISDDRIPPSFTAPKKATRKP